MAGLYAGLANGGSFAPPIVRRDRPAPAPVRLIGPTAAWYVADVLADAPLPEGFASLPVALRDRRIAYKTGTSAGFRDAWAAAYSTNWTVVVWVGHADGTPRPGQLGRVAALPIALQGLRPPARRGQSRCTAHRPTCSRGLPSRPAAAHAHAGPGRRETSGGPRIAYPPADARIELAAREAVPLNAMGGQGRLRWLVDGRPLDGNQWVPDGAGVARLAVVDEAGRSTSVTVRIVERR